MTKKQFDKIFIQENMTAIKRMESQYRKTKDIPLRCQSYNDYLDYFYKDGLVTDKQVLSWCIPKRLIS